MAGKAVHKDCFDTVAKYCNECGKAVDEFARFCSGCGKESKGLTK